MRKILAVSALGLLLAPAANAQKNNRESIEGNGNIVTREVAVQSFTALKASGVYELNLSQGSKESVKIEADENLQEYFEVKNNGTKLVIDMDKLKNKSLNGKLKLKVYVTFKKLTDIELKTVGNIKSEEQLSFDDLKISNNSVGNLSLNLNANSVKMRNQSVGNVTLTGKAQDAVFDNNGVGSLKAGDFIVQNVKIDNDGVGSAEVNAAKDIQVKENFLGKVTNKGAAPIKSSKKTVI
jgi:hypothetical protein